MEMGGGASLRNLNLTPNPNPILKEYASMEKSLRKATGVAQKAISSAKDAKEIAAKHETALKEAKETKQLKELIDQERMRAERHEHQTQEWLNHIVKENSQVVANMQMDLQAWKQQWKMEWQSITARAKEGGFTSANPCSRRQLRTWHRKRPSKNWSGA